MSWLFRFKEVFLFLKCLGGSGVSLSMASAAYLVVGFSSDSVLAFFARLVLGFSSGSVLNSFSH